MPIWLYISVVIASYGFQSLYDYRNGGNKRRRIPFNLNVRWVLNTDTGTTKGDSNTLTSTTQIAEENLDIHTQKINETPLSSAKLSTKVSFVVNWKPLNHTHFHLCRLNCYYNNKETIITSSSLQSFCIDLIRCDVPSIGGNHMFILKQGINSAITNNNSIVPICANWI